MWLRWRSAGRSFVFGGCQDDTGRQFAGRMAWSREHDKFSKMMVVQAAHATHLNNGFMENYQNVFAGICCIL